VRHKERFKRIEIDETDLGRLNLAQLRLGRCGQGKRAECDRRNRTN
jgi:hypothetical protein